MFLIKPATITVDFFTSNAAIDGPTAPDMAAKFIPAWWRNLPKESASQSFGGGTSMKRCPGFVDYFRRSIMLPMWCELAVWVGEENNPNYRYQYADQKSSADCHPNTQRGEYLPEEKYQHLKLINPWRAKTKHNVNWVFSQPTWCFETPEQIVVPTGMLNLEEQHALHINLFIPRHAHEARTVILGAGQPMAALTPVSDKKVVIKRHQVSPQEIEALNHARIFFFGDIMKTRALRKTRGNT